MGPGLSVADSLRIVLSLAFLLAFSYMDLKSREVRDELVYAFLALSLAFYAIYTSAAVQAFGATIALVYSLLSLVPLPLLLMALAVKGLVGWADFFVALSVALAFTYPWQQKSLVSADGVCPALFPPILAVTLYAVAIQLAAHFAMALTSIYRLGARFPSDLSRVERVFLLLTARPMRAGEFIKSRFYLLSIKPVRQGGQLVWRLSGGGTTGAGEDKELVSKLLLDGLLRPDDVVWVSYGHPFILYLTLGLAVYLVLGPLPMCRLFGAR